MKLALRITALLLVVLGMAMGLTGFLNYAKYETAFLNLLQSRLLVVGQGLRDTAETSLNLGLTLGELANVEELIVREAQNDPNILSIAVVDAEGTQLFISETEAAEGTPVPAREIAPLRQGQGDWRLLEDDRLVIGLGIINPFGQPSGAVLIRYSTEPLRAELGAVRRGLIRDGLLVLAFAAAISLAACALVLQLLNSSLRRIERDLDLLERETEAPLIDAPVAPVMVDTSAQAPGEAAGELEAGVVGFSRTIGSALKELRETARLIEVGREGAERRGGRS